MAVSVSADDVALEHRLAVESLTQEQKAALGRLHMAKARRWATGAHETTRLQDLFAEEAERRNRS